MSGKRTDAGAAIAGLFETSSATGGLAGRNRPAAVAPEHDGPPRLRQGVELTEDHVAYLRSLSRPQRTGQPRTLGSKFVATGVLDAAIELLLLLRADGIEIDMRGVRAGDLDEMTARARAALMAAARTAAADDTR